MTTVRIPGINRDCGRVRKITETIPQFSSICCTVQATGDVPLERGPDRPDHLVD
jgi:hypothetical protein